MFISVWAIFIVLTKIAFHASEKFALPDSALLIVAGFLVRRDDLVDTFTQLRLWFYNSLSGICSSPIRFNCTELCF
jgi:hypothetical protein